MEVIKHHTRLRCSYGHQCVREAFYQVGMVTDNIAIENIGWGPGERDRCGAVLYECDLCGRAPGNCVCVWA